MLKIICWDVWEAFLYSTIEMVKLKLRPVTEIGNRNYVSQSEELGKYFTIAIITEGCKEEIIYLKHIRKLYQESSDKNVTVAFVNDEYIKEKVAISESHPLKRLEAMKERIKNSQLPADENWLVCDRDSDSFTNTQYDDICKECANNGIHLVVSNPAFQLWLLFHFISSLDELALDKHKKCKAKIKKIEKELKKHVEHYEHGTLNMYDFDDYINDAIKHSSPYSLDLSQLKNKTGTNFGELINSLKDNFGIK